jgi:hypothetical protein
MRIEIKLLLLITAMWAGCKADKTEQTQAQRLIETLKSVQAKGTLFGHQDDLAYGMKWSYIEGESDVKRVAGDYPALFGWELGGLERGDLKNLDDVPFDVMRQLAIKADEMGGINTFSWHPYSVVNGKNSWNTDTTTVKYIIPGGSRHEQFKAQLDQIANFFLQLKTSDGKLMPVIFRPWHEMSGGWFWWGTKLTSPEEYKTLFRFTIDYLVHEKGLTNMVICYSPNSGFQTEQEYLTWYPGNDIIDIMGVDDYQHPSTVDWPGQLQKTLDIVIKTANKNQKLAAFSETGYENIPDSLWFTDQLGKAIEPDSIAQNLSYVMVWRNDSNVHHFFAYDGHPSEANAKSFLNQPNIWLLNDFNKNKK